MKSRESEIIFRHVFSRGNILAVLIIASVPVLLGFLRYLFGDQYEDGFDSSHFAFNSLYSLLVSSSLYFGCAGIVRGLNLKLPWKDNLKKRLFIEILLIFSYTSLTQYLILLLLEKTPLFEEGLTTAEIFNNIIFSNTITLIVVAIIESIYFFRSWKESLLATERLQKEHLQSSLSNLKAQLDPHFMFNSLNVLSTLIRKDPAKAERFVDDFAKVYRYLLDVKNEMAVPLREELAFVERYLSLQKIRFDQGLQFNTRINPEHLNHYLPPLSLQEMVSNAIKHNIVSAEKPLRLELQSNGTGLLIKNNVQYRSNGVESTGIGLRNLKERYRYLGNEAPSFEISDGTYCARLPLIKLEE